MLRQPVVPVIPFDWEHFPENLPELLGDRYQYEYRGNKGAIRGHVESADENRRNIENERVLP